MEDIRELAKEVLKKRELSEDKKEDKKVEETMKTKEEIKVDEHLEANGSLKVHTTKPLFIDCPYCGERRKPRGIGGHVREKHGVPGVSMQELFDLKKTEKSLEEFTREKLGNKDLEIKNIPTEILDREFPTWKIPDLEEENPEEIEEESPEEILEEESPEEILEEESPEDDEKNPVERRRLNLMPPFSPFDRRK